MRNKSIYAVIVVIFVLTLSGAPVVKVRRY